MINYKRLNDFDREEISRMLSQKYSLSDIAKHLGRHISTISREVSQGGCNKYTYRDTKAQNRARRQAAKRKAGKYRLNNDVKLWRYICKNDYAHCPRNNLYLYLCSSSWHSQKGVNGWLETKPQKKI